MTTHIHLKEEHGAVRYNQDRLKKTVSKKVLSGQYERLESDII